MRSTYLWLAATYLLAPSVVLGADSIGQEVAVARHLLDGEDLSISLGALVQHGQK
jgi:hypothetical protein